MSDPERIYLQPECCSDPDVGRLWCQDDGPQTCPDGAKWTPYVLASEITRLQSEVERLNQQLEKAEQNCRERIKADRIYCMKHGDEAAREMASRAKEAEAEVERLRGRCGELEEFAAFAQQTAEWELDPDYVPPETAKAMLALLEASRQITGEVEACDYENAWLLRKQAEAVEAAATEMLEERPEFDVAHYWLVNQALSLRQQAAESEGG